MEAVTVTRFRRVKSATRAGWSDVPKVESMTKEVASLALQRGIRSQLDIKEIKDQFGVFDETEDSISCLQIVALVKSGTFYPCLGAHYCQGLRPSNRPLFVLQTTETSATLTG